MKDKPQTDETIEQKNKEYKDFMIEKVKLEITTIKQLYETLIYTISVLNRDLDEVFDLIDGKSNQK